MQALAPFTYESFPMRAVFREGAVDHAAGEAARLGLNRIFLIGSTRWLERIRMALGPSVAAVFADAAQHTPVAVTERALVLLNESEADGILSIGGGSAIGLGKALALRTTLPLIALPTTYSGSEMTSVVGQTHDRVKKTKKDPSIRPSVVIYDPDLTHSLDIRTAAASGMNAIAHGVEALYAPDGNPVVTLMAREGVGSMFMALEKIVADPSDASARQRAFYGAWLNGLCLGSTTMGLHHKLCHTLGGMFGLPHAEMHAVMLPHSLAYNRPSIPDIVADLARTLGVADAVQAFAALLRKAGLPVSLAELGMPADGIEAAADLAMRDAYANPRPLERNAIIALLRAAHAGTVPASA